MGEGLFVHASNSLGVISIACSIIVPFEEGPKKKNTVLHRKLPFHHTAQWGGFHDLWSTTSPFQTYRRLFCCVDSNQSAHRFFYFFPPLILCNCNHLWGNNCFSVAADRVSALLRSIINCQCCVWVCRDHFIFLVWYDLRFVVAMLMRRLAASNHLGPVFIRLFDGKKLSCADKISSSLCGSSRLSRQTQRNDNDDIHCPYKTGIKVFYLLYKQNWPRSHHSHKQMNKVMVVSENRMIPTLQA